MKEEKDALLRLAQAVTDGTPVDWDAEGKDRVGLMGRLTRLRAIEKSLQRIKGPRWRRPGLSERRPTR